METAKITISKAREGLDNKEFSSVELTRAFLDAIRKTDGGISAYLSVDEEGALAQASKADARIAEGNARLLTGIPCSVKDAILIKGQPATAASKMLKSYLAPYDATVIMRLKAQDAVFLGKTNLDEFAMGASTENSAFKVTRNPHDQSRVAGGSSGGAAASVAAGQAVYSLGSDTGGSIRLPASFCGVVGLNPTYGTVSRFGLIAFASSLDQIGPMAHTVEDVKAVFAAVSGRDPRDATSADFKFQNSNFKLKGCRIGVPEEYFGQGMDPEVERVVRNAIEKAGEAGATIVPVSLPSTAYAVACYYIIAPSEASSNLARFDGMRYGLSRQDAASLIEVYLKSRGEGFGAEPKRRILLGTYALSSGYYDAYYKKAQEARNFIRSDFARAFEKVDVIFSPVSPFPAFKVGEKAQDPLAMYLVDAYTGPVKLAGLPALSLPAGNTGDLPVGLQIIGNHFEDAKLLAVAREMEKVLS